ncbi:hypothetical protein AVEN_128535-1 [Araneus ventricosus]|uniref:Uncharacterized protein n=1 Tax=Araneus ventricosus TaxID=182803 RepID=A0A4Y1ZUQ5_ARAVE|nr:hypothetical protein AVEN_128535-1 [Araneus ventricosus]
MEEDPEAAMEEDPVVVMEEDPEAAMEEDLVLEKEVEEDMEGAVEDTGVVEKEEEAEDTGEETNLKQEETPVSFSPQWMLFLSSSVQFQATPSIS